MSDIRAEDLPAGSIVVDDDRGLVWIAVQRFVPAYGRWSVSGSPTPITDRDIDAALRHTATVLRVGDGSGQ